MTAKQLTIVWSGLVLVVGCFLSLSARAAAPGTYCDGQTCISSLAEGVALYIADHVPPYIECRDRGGSGGPNLNGTTWTIAVRYECFSAAQNSWITTGDRFYTGEDVPACQPENQGVTKWLPGWTGGDACDETSQCKLQAVNTNTIGSNDLVEFVTTADECTTEPVVPATQSPQCITSGSDSWCTESGLADQNCGMLNGGYVCLDTVPSGGCTFFGNGDMACATTAGSPPAPDNGTPGQQAAPDLVVTTTPQGGAPVTTNIYNSSTVNNSAGGTSGTAQSTQPTEPTPVELDLSELIEQSQEPTAGSEIAGLEADILSELGSIETALGDPGSGFAAPTVTSGDTIASALESSACQDISLAYPGGGGIALFPCSAMADFRAISGWILRITLAMFAFNLVMTRPGT